VNHWYARYINRPETTHLSCREMGALVRLEDYYQSSERMIPLELERVYRIVMCQDDSDKEATRYVLEYFFTKTELGFYSESIEKEIKKRNKISKERKQAQSKGVKNRNKNRRLDSNYNCKTFVSDLSLQNDHKTFTNADTIQYNTIQDTSEANASSVSQSQEQDKKSEALDKQFAELSAKLQTIIASPMPINTAIVRSWLADGVPADLIERTVAEVRAKRDRPPASMKYFQSAIWEAWEVHKASQPKQLTPEMEAFYKSEIARLEQKERDEIEKIKQEKLAAMR